MSNMLFGFNPLFFFVFLLLTMPLSMSYAALATNSLSTIKGTAPRLTPEIEAHLDDLNILGLKMDDKDIFYGEDAENIPLSIIAYPFVSRFTAAPPRKPNADEFVDENGDEIDDVIPASSYQLTWYYTDSKNNLVEFVPTTKDTFCSLSKANKLGPYKLRVTGGLTLTSKKGDPRETVYPNDQQTTVPSKLFTVIKSAGICYAKPELKPAAANKESDLLWDSTKGFVAQLNSNAINFPTTGFYGAKFDLVPGNVEMLAQYNWSLQQNDSLASLTVNPSTITIAFDTASAKDPQIAWHDVLGSLSGYPVTVLGTSKGDEPKIEYKFTLKKWFAGFDKNQVEGKASSAKATDIDSQCKELPGKYRMITAPELSNAPYGQQSTAGKAVFTRGIGTLLSEWGDANQDTYPNSWAAAKSQSNLFRRIWVWDPIYEKYCDLHTYDAIYHCVAEADKKMVFVQPLMIDNS